MSDMRKFWSKFAKPLADHGHSAAALFAALCWNFDVQLPTIFCVFYVVILGYERNKYREVAVYMNDRFRLGLWATERMDNIKMKRAFTPSDDWSIVSQQEYERNGNRFFVAVSDRSLIK